MAEFKLTPLSKIMSKQYKNQWLIKDHFEMESIGMLFGAPASAKSFIAMDIAFCIAEGIDWNGNPTIQGKVVYLAGEGHSGLQKRFKALELKYKTTASDIFLSDLPASLSDTDNADAVFQEIKRYAQPPKLIIIDTLHRNFGPGDRENSSRDFGNFIRIIDIIMKEFGTAVLLIHHSGHSASDRSRGSSSIRAALDVEYQVTKDNDLVTMTCTKAKEFQEPNPMSFNLVTQLIPTLLDAAGKPVESAILDSTTYTAPVRTASLTQKDNLVLKALTDSIAKNGILASKAIANKYPELDGKKYIHIDDWRAEAYPLLDQNSGGTNKPQANQKAFHRAKGKLLHANKIVTESDHYWEAA